MAWRNTAQQRIDRYRKKQSTIILKDAFGNPISGAMIDAKLVRHEFQFGTVFSVKQFNMIRKHLHLFGNQIGFENALKYKHKDTLSKNVPEVMAWARENAVTVRGHTLVWPGWRHMHKDALRFKNTPDIKRLQQFVDSSGRSFIDREIKIKDDNKLPSLQIDKSNIKFDNVSFQYETGKERAIKNISIDIEGEKITALVGHSGAGKSTILNLIPRFYEPQKGKIFLDDQEINKVSLKSLRDKISLVSQDVILFDDSVENNIKYAKLDATEQEIKNACKLAAADEFIDKLPNCLLYTSDAADE